ncbi:MAG: efflux RND transporter periplasmic adaptor subunit, partial [Planctomycetota bacterium]
MGYSLLLILASALSPLQGEGPPPTPVRAVRIELRDVQSREAVTGGLRASMDAVLAAREEGAVASVVVREGAAVRKNDALIVIDQKRLVAQRAGVEATLAESEATLVRARSEAEDAALDFEALEAAAKVGQAVSQRELRRARTLVSSSKALVIAAEKGVQALRAELDLWNLRLEDATLRAPFDGTVVDVHVEIGEWIQPGDDAVTLVSTDSLEVWLDVPERLMGAWRGALPDALQVNAGGSELSASELRVVPRVDATTRTFSLVASLPSVAGAPTRLSPGMSASAWLPVGPRASTLMIPKDALVYRPTFVETKTEMLPQRI